MPDFSSDYLIQRRSNRAELYRTNPGIWFSSELKRWMITNPSIIKDVMNNAAFAVPTYDINSILQRLNIDLGYVKRVTEFFPLASEGEKHKALREKFTRAIAANTASALAAFETDLSALIKAISHFPDGHKFCLLDKCLRPALRSAVSHLAGIDIDKSLDIDGISQLFDDTISMRKQIRINATLGRLVDDLGGIFDDEEKYFRVAIVALSANTLLGSLVQSVVQKLMEQADLKMSSINWGSDFSTTGLPLVEKKAVCDAVIAGQLIREGEKCPALY